jgi:AcrR family transcriptional regulator
MSREEPTRGRTAEPTGGRNAEPTGSRNAEPTGGRSGRPTGGRSGEPTRARLVRVARELFAERGYAAVGTEEIVARAGVTRGALYHHFADKQDLFRAVHEELESQLVASIGEQIGGIDDPWELAVSGVRAFLDACADPALRRISLIDAPVVLGWEEWREIDARYGLGLVEFALRNAMEEGVLRRQEVRPLAHLLLGAMTEAAMVIANSPDHGEARQAVEPALIALLDGLRQ